MKKFIFLAAVVLTVTSVHGETRRARKKMESCNPCTPTCVSKADDGIEIQTTCAYNASARYDILRPWDVYFTADFLLWHVSEDNLEYGLSAESVFGDVPHSKVLSPEFHYTPGFRLGIGGNFDYDNWEIYSEWTHIVAHGGNHADAPSHGTIYPTQMPAYVAEMIFVDLAAGRPGALFAKTTWKMVYNTLDLAVGRPFWVGKKLSFQPLVGFRGAHFKQQYNTTYQTVGLPDNVFLGTTQCHSKLDSWSIGPRFALDTNWFFGYGFRLFGDVGLSVLYTDFNIGKKVTNDFIINNAIGKGGPLLSTSHKRDYHQSRPSFEGGIGIAWGHYFDNCKSHVDLALSYEYTCWVDANGDFHFVDDLNPGNIIYPGGELSLHGATVRARFDF